MSAKDDKHAHSSLKRRILAAIAAGPACLLAAAVVTPSDAQAAPAADQHKDVTPGMSMPSDMPAAPHQWWGNGWRHPWGNWNNWHNWPNWNNWHNWGNL
jgi:hypothetical protein